MGMGAVRVEDRVLAAFGGLMGTTTRFEPGRDVKYGGVLCALPALLANGLLHKQEECFKLKGFYGVAHVLLLMGFLALARIKSLEKLRFEPPGEWGHVLNLHSCGMRQMRLLLEATKSYPVRRQSYKFIQRRCSSSRNIISFGSQRRDPISFKRKA